ncbi:MAG TPA: peptide chain release factor 2, partial [Pirellulaceae bacterium]|nr:peptide chain release factor 2 [Pirellulaceae bacterium]
MNSKIEPKRFRSRSSIYETVFDYDAKLAQIAAIEAKMGAPGFWDNQEKAQQAVG